MMATAHRKLILASASRARAEMLTAAGLEFDIEAAVIDEGAVREALDTEEGDMPAGDVALVLAEAKARDVGDRYPGAIVIGADQVLAFNDEILSKPESVAAAHTLLKRLKSHTHELHSAVTCVRDGKTLWQLVDNAALTMRDFSDEFLQAYLNAEGDEVTMSVGGYRLEGRGVQLFEKVEGDHFTVLGLPLVPLLGFLRSVGAVQS